jgi:hypothetical protein
MMCFALFSLALLQLRWFDLRYRIETNMSCSGHFFCDLPVSQMTKG